MSELFTNNATSTLAAGITAVATSVTVQTGDGAKYPNPTTPDFFRVVFYKKSTGELEICTCAARSGDILTITRAQESTTALALDAGDLIELRPTAAFFNSLTVTSGSIQNNSYKSGVDTGVANAYVITPTPAIASYAKNQEFWFLVVNTNTGASTLQVSGLATPPSIKLIDGSNPYAGALTAGRMAHVIHDGTNYVLQNPHEKSYFFPNVLSPLTATHYELDYNDVTPGTGTALKTLVLDAASKIISGVVEFVATTFTGNLTGNVTGDVTGDVIGNLIGPAVVTDSLTADTTNGDLALTRNGTGDITVDSVPIYGLVVLDTPLLILSASPGVTSWSTLDMSVVYAAAAAAGASKAILRVEIYAITLSASVINSARAYIRKTGSALAQSNTTRVVGYGDAYNAGIVDTVAVAECTVNLDSNSDFDWSVDEVATLDNIRITLVGYYV